MTWDYAEITVTVGNAVLQMTWDQWVVLLFGVPAIGMTQIERLRPYACFPGLSGQLGWFGGLHHDQPAFLIASVLCCLIWLFSLWKFWLRSWIDTATTHMADRFGGVPEPPKPRQKARLTRVK